MEQRKYLELTNHKIIIVSAKGIVGTEAKAVTVLIEEIEKRTGITLPNIHKWPEEKTSVIVVGSQSLLNGIIAPYSNLLEKLKIPGREGYRLLVIKSSYPIVLVVGTDAKGVLYGVGKLLRKLILRRHSIKINEDLSILSTPKYPLRGHQLGYRHINNTYDAWSIEQFDQYIRELAIFGANSIEIIPPRTADAATGPLMKVPPLEMMIKLSQIIDSYGLDVWIWYPNMGNDYTDPDCIRAELAKREEIFRKLPRIDAVFIPGGDPGNVEPNVLFPWAQRVADLLHKYHPEATIWLSSQAFDPTKEWLNFFYDNVNKEPKWLGGIIFAPWVKTPLPELRKIIPRKYPIRRCPDITHSLRCQYPVPNWDISFAMTLGRECINPRPIAEKHIHNLFAPYTIGSISYSEGINDDLNKFIWSDQDWDPKTAAVETLRDYVRFFISDEYAEDLTQGFIALEKNWEGPLAINEGVEITLKQWQMIESEAPPNVLRNYRFEMGLLRAYYDAYLRRRLIYETELERKSMDILQSAPFMGALAALEEAERILRKVRTEPVAQDHRRRCNELADELFANIGAQLTVKKHKAIAWDRGAFMDAIDMPLNNSRWLLAQFENIRKIETETERLDAIHKIINRTNPGPGGFYDNFGTVRSWTRVFKEQGWEKDPGNLSSPLITFIPFLLYQREEEQLEFRGIPHLAWISNVTTLYDAPLTISYDNLDPESSYILKVTYITGITGLMKNKIRLTANGKYIIHDFIEIKNKCPVQEFLIPKEALSNGKLDLTWSTTGGKRGCLAELWLIRKRE